MRTCDSCGADVSFGPRFCPNCGQPVAAGVAALNQAASSNHSKPMRAAYLEFLGGPEDGRIARLSGERVTVGRREDSDIHIPSDSAVSRRHAFIYCTDDQFWIEDCKSSFGTWVDGGRVPVEMAAPMYDGSLIRLARTTMLFHLGEPQEIELRGMAEQ